MSAIRILNGVYRNQPVKGVTFELVKGFQTGAKGGYVTVKSNGYFGAEFDVVRVRVDSIRDLEYTNDMIQDNTVQLKMIQPLKNDPILKNKQSAYYMVFFFLSVCVKFHI